jgi:hypothetical protein
MDFWTELTEEYMAIKAKLDKNVNTLKKELEDVYIRIDNFTVFPKQGFIQVGIKGYLDAESGKAVSAYEAEVKSRIEDLFKDKNILTAVTLPANQNLYEGQADLPQHIFYESYTVKMPETLGSTNDVLTYLYTEIKRVEPRFILPEDC